MRIRCIQLVACTISKLQLRRWPPQVRQQAEAALKKASQQPQIIPELMGRLQASPDPLVRQMAAVLVRKRIARHWQLLPPEARTLPTCLHAPSDGHMPQPCPHATAAHAHHPTRPVRRATVCALPTRCCTSLCTSTSTSAIATCHLVAIQMVSGLPSI
jgi:hypothetical protein